MYTDWLLSMVAMVMLQNNKNTHQPMTRKVEVEHFFFLSSSCLEISLRTCTPSSVVCVIMCVCVCDHVCVCVCVCV